MASVLRMSLWGAGLGRENMARQVYACLCNAPFLKAVESSDPTRRFVGMQHVEVSTHEIWDEKAEFRIIFFSLWARISDHKQLFLLA